jgi:hypothetical protein
MQSYKRECWRAGYGLPAHAPDGAHQGKIPERIKTNVMLRFTNTVCAQSRFPPNL